MEEDDHRRRKRLQGRNRVDTDLVVTSGDTQSSPNPEVLGDAFLVLARIGRKLQSGAFINHLFAEAGTVAATSQMLLIRLCMIWPLKAVAPAAYTYWFWQLFLRLRGKATQQDSQRKGLLGMLKTAISWSTRESMRVWLAVEALFFLYYRYKLWELGRRSASSPILAPGQPMKALRRALDTVEMIQRGGKTVDPQLELSQNLDSLSKDRRGSPCLTPKSSAHDLQAMLHPSPVESVENLLRDWNQTRLNASKMRCPDTAIIPTAITDADRAAFEQLLDDAEILALKQAETCGWFLKKERRTDRWPLSRVAEIQQGNILEWIAWAFLNCTVDEIPKTRTAEMDELLLVIIKFMEVPCQPGYNTDIATMCLTFDPIPSAHRPLVYYLVTQTIFSQVITIMLRRQGFRLYLSGTLAYWHRPAAGTASGEQESELPPIVLCHGIGVNVLPYRPLINAMLEGLPDRTFFLISLPHISMRIKEEVPSSTEMVACLSDMLASWGFASAHFVGHSFGSLPLAWMARKAPGFVGAMTFIDPVCFLLVKPDVCFNFMYREPATPTQLLLSYFGAKELYVAHSLSRNFFWHQNQLWPEELPCPTLVVLGARDSIVPTHSVRRYLASYKQRHKVDSLKLLWFPELGHGEMNFGPAGEAACAKIVSEMNALESEYPGQLQRDPSPPSA